MIWPFNRHVANGGNPEADHASPITAQSVDAAYNKTRRGPMEWLMLPITGLLSYVGNVFTSALNGAAKFALPLAGVGAAVGIGSALMANRDGNGEGVSPLVRGAGAAVTAVVAGGVIVGGASAAGAATKPLRDVVGGVGNAVGNTAQRFTAQTTSDVAPPANTPSGAQTPQVQVS